MVVPTDGYGAMTTAGYLQPGQSLLQRLPDRLFGPLASPNRHQYWMLLSSLHERRFGPDAPIPPSLGFPCREITLDIEEDLLAQEAWQTEDGESPDTPIGIRAIGVFNRLRDCGWLRVDRHGVREMVTMPPTVTHFMTRLVEFAHSGPVFVAGKVRSIEANLQLIVHQNADGDTLQEAAAQARNLLEHVRNTGTNVRDLMASLGADMTTAQYVKRFFTDFIERVFIGDYRELRTREHPLSRRGEIIRTVELLHANQAHRDRLIGWYETKRAPGDTRRAEILFERDIQRLLEITRIDEYLDRLDEEIRRANKRALAFLDYRLRSLRPVDRLVGQAIESVLQGSREGGIAVTEVAPFAPGELMSATRLAQPRKEIIRPEASMLRSQVLSIEQEARARLQLRARDARTVTPPKLAEFVRGQLDENGQQKSDQLAIESIQDIRAMQTLSAVSMAMSSPSRTLRLGAMTVARGFLVHRDGELEKSGPWLSLVPFRLELRRRENPNNGVK